MPFVFLFLGAVMIVAGVRGTQDELGALVKDLFTGPQNLTMWGLAILMIGVIGYVKQLRTFSVTFMALILIAMLAGNRQFFEQLFDQINKAVSVPSGGAGEGSGPIDEDTETQAEKNKRLGLFPEKSASAGSSGGGMDMGSLMSLYSQYGSMMG